MEPLGRTQSERCRRLALAGGIRLSDWLGEQDLADGGSDRFLDAMVAWGDASILQQRIQAHFDAGASHVCIQAPRADGQPMPDWQALTALAPR